MMIQRKLFRNQQELLFIRIMNQRFRHLLRYLKHCGYNPNLISKIRLNKHIFKCLRDSNSKMNHIYDVGHSNSNRNNKQRNKKSSGKMFSRLEKKLEWNGFQVRADPRVILVLSSSISVD